MHLRCLVKWHSRAMTSQHWCKSGYAPLVALMSCWHVSLRRHGRTSWAVCSQLARHLRLPGGHVPRQGPLGDDATAGRRPQAEPPSRGRLQRAPAAGGHGATDGLSARLRSHADAVIEQLTRMLFGPLCSSCGQWAGQHDRPAARVGATCRRLGLAGCLPLTRWRPGWARSRSRAASRHCGCPRRCSSLAASWPAGGCSGVLPGELRGPPMPQA